MFLLRSAIEFLVIDSDSTEVPGKMKYVFELEVPRFCGLDHLILENPFVRVCVF